MCYVKTEAGDPSLRREGAAVQGTGSAGVLRNRDGGEQRVTPLELFFDLVYVFAITQLSHFLLEHPTIGGVLQTLFLLLVVWWAWMYTTWAANWLDPASLPVRLMLIAVMLASLVMSVAIPQAFGERGLMFALAYVAIQVGRTAFIAIAFDVSSPLGQNFQRILAWFVVSAMFWVAGALVGGEARYVLWIVALALEYAGPVTRFWMPGLGRSNVADWSVEGSHLAERCQLFVIIALGESIIITGATFGEIEVSTATMAAFVAAFVGSAALWWIYFVRAAGVASDAIAHSEDPGRIARSAYTYFHLPMVAGIIAVAAADELIVAHPGDPGTIVSVALTLGGAALFVAGHGFFLWAITGLIPFSRLAAVAALVALAPVGFAVPALALAVAATLVVIALAAWDYLAHRKPAPSPPQPAP